MTVQQIPIFNVMDVWWRVCDVYLLWSRVVLFMVGLLTDVRSLIRLLSAGGIGEMCVSVLRSVNITAGPSVFLSRSESNSKHLTYTHHQCVTVKEQSGHLYEWTIGRVCVTVIPWVTSGRVWWWASALEIETGVEDNRLAGGELSLGGVWSPEGVLVRVSCGSRGPVNVTLGLM